MIINSQCLNIIIIRLVFKRCPHIVTAAIHDPPASVTDSNTPDDTLDSIEVDEDCRVGMCVRYNFFCGITTKRLTLAGVDKAKKVHGRHVESK